MSYQVYIFLSFLTEAYLYQRMKHTPGSIEPGVLLMLL